MKTNSQKAELVEKKDREIMTKLLRARCRGDLKKLAKQAARLLQLDEADVIRIGTQKYAASVVYQTTPNAT